MRDLVQKEAARMTAHDKLRLRRPLDESFESRSRCTRENAWLRGLTPQTAEDRTLVWDRKSLVREARDMASCP